MCSGHHNGPCYDRLNRRADQAEHTTIDNEVSTARAWAACLLGAVDVTILSTFALCRPYLYELPVTIWIVRRAVSLKIKKLRNWPTFIAY